jgi:hypothetical protein
MYSVCAAVAAMVAKGVKITPTGYEYPVDYTGPHLPEPSALPSDDADALAVVAYGGYDDSAAAAGAPGDAAGRSNVWVVGAQKLLIFGNCDSSMREKRTGAAASVERRRRCCEPGRAISPY